MFNKYKNGSKVIVYGAGKKDGKFYKNIPATVIEMDPYYRDYHLKFKDGTEDWLSEEDLRNPYAQKKRRR